MKILLVDVQGTLTRNGVAEWVKTQTADHVIVWSSNPIMAFKAVEEHELEAMPKDKSDYREVAEMFDNQTVVEVVMVDDDYAITNSTRRFFEMYAANRDLEFTFVHQDPMSI